MKNYIVTYTLSYTVEAENEEEALDKADDLIDRDYNSGWFCFDDWAVVSEESEE